MAAKKVLEAERDGAVAQAEQLQQQCDATSAYAAGERQKAFEAKEAKAALESGRTPAAAATTTAAAATPVPSYPADFPLNDWQPLQVAQLQAALKQFPSSMEKAQRWRSVAPPCSTRRRSCRWTGRWCWWQ